MQPKNGAFITGHTPAVARQGIAGNQFDWLVKLSRRIISACSRVPFDLFERIAHPRAVDEDREACLALVHRYVVKRGVSLWAYCLMRNHVHLIMVPNGEHSLSQALRNAHTVYAMRLNQRTKLSDHCTLSWLRRINP